MGFRKRRPARNDRARRVTFVNSGLELDRRGRSIRNNPERRRPRSLQKDIPMGDKSPKATQKKNSQKQAKTAKSDNRKKDAITAQQAPKLKAEAARKK
jgi:hypothetical protein